MKGVVEVMNQIIENLKKNQDYSATGNRVLMSGAIIPFIISILLFCTREFEME